MRKELTFLVDSRVYFVRLKHYKNTMFISLTEAATLLGVTTETLRNWDKSGKLQSHRDPKNNYRNYKLKEVQALINANNLEKKKEKKNSLKPAPAGSKGHSVQLNAGDKDFKRALVRVHKVLRDVEGSSSIVERFDEVTKLIFLKLLLEKESSASFSQQTGEINSAYAKRLKSAFVERANKSDGLFPEKFKRISLSDKALVEAAGVLAEVDLSSSRSDIKGLAYEEMIRNTFDKGDHQQFFTPPPIVEFLVALIGENITGCVCDPASGTGGFLVEMVKQGCDVKEIFGLEIDDRLAWVSGINLSVHGAEKFQTKCLSDGGTLGREGESYYNSMDVIVTNPPFGSDFTGDELQGYSLGIGRSSRRRGVLFIERCLQMLKPNGLLGIVIDEGVLSLPTNEDVRRLILENSELQAVISLPDHAFMPYASVATSILLLKKRPPPIGVGKAFFGRAENVGRKPNGEPDVIYDETGTALLNSDLPRILKAWRDFKKTGVTDESENIYLANIPYGDLKKRSGECRIDFRFLHPSRVAAEEALKASKHELVKLSDICDVRNESFVPSVDFADQMIPYTGLAQIESRIGRAQQITVSGSSLKSAVKRYEAGDILFAKMRPSLRKVAYVDFAESGYASAECIILTMKTDDGERQLIDPYLLSILLRSNFVYGQIIHLIAGIGRPRVSIKDLLNVKIPLLDKKAQEKLLHTFMQKKQRYEAQRIEARRLADASAQAELEAIDSVGQQFVEI